MIVLVLSAVPEGLRGHVTRWLLEISPGVFVGTLNARVRERLWQIVVEMSGTGRAIMVYRARSEQGLEFKTYGDPWKPADFEGLTLMIRPIVVTSPSSQTAARKPGASNFQKNRRARKGFPKSDRSGR